MKKESNWEWLLYVNIRNNEKWKSKFFIWEKEYSVVSWTLAEIKTETKEIEPKKWENMWKKVTVYNLVLKLVDFDWEFMLTIPLYSSPWRTVLNALAWSEELDEIFFQVYDNKYWYRTISVKKWDQKDSPYYQWKYTFDELQKMVEEKKIKWELKKDRDALTDKLVEELLPIIEEKLNYWQEAKEEPTASKKTNIANDDDDLPF